MADAPARTAPARLAALRRLVALAQWAALAALALIVAAQLLFFATHAAHVLGYPYPLDYGEGPLLAQVRLLLEGTPVWRLYADPGLPPYAVVNYPPVYHLLVALVALPLGRPLLAGRLVSLVAALGCVAALWLLSGAGREASGERRAAFSERPGDQETRRPGEQETRRSVQCSGSILRLLLVLAFLALPIVREWAVVLRVDMLGVCLGLCGLLIVRRGAGRRALWAAIPLALSLLVKPSLIAAPAAALLWLLLRDWRRALQLGALVAIGGGLLAGLLQLGSGGWFAVHVLAANANPWERKLAYGFWHDQLVILWPLVAAAAASALLQIIKPRPPARVQEPGSAGSRSSVPALDAQRSALLPLYYTLFGAITALGVGKVGAYANYFLELYAGLIWLCALAAGRWTMDDGRWMAEKRLASSVYRLASFAPLIAAGLVMGALLRYYPTWSANYLKPAGLIEGSNPPRVVVGGYGVWQDLRRERDILAALVGINAALDDEVRRAGAPIVTDVPGVAAQAGQLTRLQAFEHRQLYDAGRWDQRPLLRDMADGRVPLVVLDYLGNWLTPEMIALITHRYAQDGSRGTYDLYRPVEPGPAAAADLPFSNGLRLAGYHLAPSPGRPAYHAGETVLLTLDWQYQKPESQAPGAERNLDVVVQVTDGHGSVFLETARPLLYGALAPEDWGGEAIQHMQPIALPDEIPPLGYRLAVTLREGGRDLAAPRDLAALPVEQQDGRVVRLGLPAPVYMPAPLLAAWERLGGEAGPGEPLMPAVPLPGYTLQCFARSCLRLVGGQAEQAPLGELVHLGDVGLRPVEALAPAGEVSAGFRAFWQERGGEAVLGSAITPELLRGDRIVQYTRYARLERPVAGGAARLGRLGEEYLRLPGDVAYRWP